MSLYTSTVVVRQTAPRRWAKLTKSALYAVGLPIVLLIVWTVWATVSPTKFFPPPAEVFGTFVETWIGPTLFTDVIPSLTRLVLAIGIAITIGVAAGTVIGLTRWLREFTEPTLEFFRAIPPPVLIPVFVAFLGVTPQMQMLVIVAGAVWPVLLNTIDGVRATDAVMTETAHSFSLTPAQRLFGLILPAASPRIMAGIRLTLSVALIMMVISELFYSSSGLGYQIKYAQTNFLIAQMWSGVLLLGLLGILLAAIFGFAERRLLRWYHGIKEVERA
ncbi:MAG TPA: nitrate ABC transporter permease [Microbacterium sp.]|nr:nitrate ABC transporter permease [Microbacterium sp.]HBR89449.1 nitrate ABC transporter permease [Microbacterium sp.]